MDGLITVDVYHRGMFRVDPIMFIDAEVVKVTNINFGKMDFESFHLFLKKLLKDPCNHIYYCIPRFTLTLGLRWIKNDIDYHIFLKNAYDSGKIGVYVDVYVQDMTNYLVDGIQLYESSDDAISLDESVDHKEDEQGASTCTPHGSHEQQPDTAKAKGPMEQQSHLQRDNQKLIRDKPQKLFKKQRLLVLLQESEETVVPETVEEQNEDNQTLIQPPSPTNQDPNQLSHQEQGDFNLDLEDVMLGDETGSDATMTQDKGELQVELEKTRVSLQVGGSRLLSW